MPFVKEGRFTALDEGAAHEDDDGRIGRALAADFRQQVGVAGVKGIKFGDDGNGFHGSLLYVHNFTISVSNGAAISGAAA